MVFSDKSVRGIWTLLALGDGSIDETEPAAGRVCSLIEDAEEDTLE